MSNHKYFCPWFLLLLTMVAGSPVPSTAAAADPNSVNIVFISVDDLNDWVGFLGGHPRAKRPDELPSKGTDNPRHVVDLGKDRPAIILPLNGMPSDQKPDDPGAESFDWGPLDVPDSAMGDAQIVDWAIERFAEDVDAAMKNRLARSLPKQTERPDQKNR